LNKLGTNLTTMILVCGLIACQGVPSETVETQNPSHLKGRELSELERDIELYKTFGHRKAFATAIDENGAHAYGYSYENPLERIAISEALRFCNEAREEHGIKKECTIHLNGNSVINDL